MGQKVKTFKTTRYSGVSPSWNNINNFGFFSAIDTINKFIPQIKISFKTLKRTTFFIFFTFFGLIKNVTILALYPWSHGPPTTIVDFGFSEYKGLLWGNFRTPLAGAQELTPLRSGLPRDDCLHAFPGPLHAYFPYEPPCEPRRRRTGKGPSSTTATGGAEQRLYRTLHRVYRDNFWAFSWYNSNTLMRYCQMLNLYTTMLFCYTRIGCINYQ